MSDALRQARIDLAAALRWSARLKYQQGVCNHYSLLAPDSDELFLVNPEGLFWSEVTASSLLLCDLDGRIVEGEGTVELSAFCLHAPIHRRNKNARAVLHTHAPYATALCLIEDAVVEPVFLAGLQPSVAAAFDRLYYLEETCQRQIIAMSAQRPLRSVPGAIAKGLADMVPAFDAYAEKHLTAIKRVLDREEPEYAS